MHSQNPGVGKTNKEIQAEKRRLAAKLEVENAAQRRRFRESVTPTKGSEIPLKKSEKRMLAAQLAKQERECFSPKSLKHVDGSKNSGQGNDKVASMADLNCVVAPVKNQVNNMEVRLATLEDKISSDRSLAKTNGIKGPFKKKILSTAIFMMWVDLQPKSRLLLPTRLPTVSSTRLFPIFRLRKSNAWCWEHVSRLGKPSKLSSNEIISERQSGSVNLQI
uniref:Uncharacterized protein n=1 Tax=Entomoneis paludosa TaxID=265537 RepID=A0A7S2Y2R8_9STRA|mmetsp:Transcript_14114/g.29264  ORF Transcript_14114/g.29264 Transcript_14114/m.29264 type:complete len:220 (+) Transcript_14114:2-661(+)